MTNLIIFSIKKFIFKTFVYVLYGNLTLNYHIFTIKEEQLFEIMSLIKIYYKGLDINILDVEDSEYIDTLDKTVYIFIKFNFNKLCVDITLTRSSIIMKSEYHILKNVILKEYMDYLIIMEDK